MALGRCPLSIFCSRGTPPREVLRVCGPSTREPRVPNGMAARAEQAKLAILDQTVASIRWDDLAVSRGRSNSQFPEFGAFSPAQVPAAGAERAGGTHCLACSSHTVDYAPFTKSQLARTQSTLRPRMVTLPSGMCAGSSGWCGTSRRGGC